MKQYVFAIILLYMLLVGPAQAEPLARYISIGADKPFAKSGKDPLPGAKLDAKAVGEAINGTSSIGAGYVMTSASPKRLRPNVANVKWALANGSAGMGKLNVLYLSITAHVVAWHGKACLVLEDGYLPLEKVGQILTDSSDATVVVFLQCCRNSGAPGASPEEMFHPWTSGQKNIMIIYSVGLGERDVIPDKTTSSFADAICGAFSPYSTSDDESAVTAGRLRNEITRNSQGDHQAEGYFNGESMEQTCLFYTQAKPESAAYSFPYAVSLNLYTAGKIDEAIVVTDNALRTHPRDAKLLNLRALLATAKGDFVLSLDIYQRAINDKAAARAYPVLYGNRARCYVRYETSLKDKADSNWKAQAEFYYSESTTYDSGSAFAWSNAARFQELLGNPVAAEQCYDEGILTDPTNALCHYNRGVFALGRYKVLPEKDVEGKAHYLRLAMNDLGKAVERTKDLRHSTFIVGTAIVLHKYAGDFERYHLPVKLSWRSLLNEATDQAYHNETERAEALAAYVELFVSDYDSALGTLTESVKSGHGIGILPPSSWLTVERYYVRAAQDASTRSVREQTANVPIEKRDAIPFFAKRLMPLVEFTLQAEKAGQAMPAATQFEVAPKSWAEFRALCLNDFGKIVASNFSSGQVADARLHGSAEWRYLIDRLPPSPSRSYAWLLLIDGQFERAEKTQKAWEADSHVQDQAFWSHLTKARATALENSKVIRS